MKLVEKIFSLEDEVVIIAGGSGQIGFELCNIVVDMGAKVIIADDDTEMAFEKIDKLSKNKEK